MEANGLGGGLFSAMGSSSMLGLELPVQNQQNSTIPSSQNPHHLTHPQMVTFAHHDPSSLKHNNGYSIGGAASAGPKSKQVAVSDDDEPGFGGDDGGGANGDGKRKMSSSQWQRMKWTDTMVRLLIMAVFYIGDEGCSEGPELVGKKKITGGLLQKKGKWKSVSQAMLEKGFYVSPQQCEDKFNDLNKRYKRVNDILGKGTACRVVENQGLLETMDLSPKMKEEVRKLLNSKHLFFREMCAYHNSCGHSTNASTGVELALAEPSHSQPIHTQQKQCLHSTDNAQAMTIPSFGKTVRTISACEDEEEDDEDEDSEDEDDEDEYVHAHHDHDDDHDHDHHDHNDDENDYERPQRKRAKKGGVVGVVESEAGSQLIQQFRSEILGAMQDGTRSSWEKKQWLKAKMVQLEEQQVRYQYEALELEKQRLKWVRFSSKKEREMEKAKFENEKRRLENERMVLIVRQKELEVHDLHHHQNHQQQNSSNRRHGDPSSITG